MKLTIDRIFHDLIPPISPEEYDLLEESILKEGCREKIVTWNNCILDGHNRYEICQKHDIKCKTIDKSFENEAEAKFWIIRNQLARRNLPPAERVRLALLLKPAIEEKAEERMKAGKADPGKKSAQGKTREEIAKLAGVSHDTVRKVETIEQKATEEVKRAARKGEISVNKAYKKEIIESKKAKKKTPKAKPLATDLVNDEIKKTFEAFYEAVRKARKNHWKDTPKKAIKNLLENLEGLLI